MGLGSAVLEVVVVDQAMKRRDLLVVSAGVGALLWPFSVWM